MEINYNMLLGRKPIRVNMKNIYSFIKQKVILLPVGAARLEVSFADRLRRITRSN